MNSNMGDKEDEELSKLLERKARELLRPWVMSLLS